MATGVVGVLLLTVLFAGPVTSGAVSLLIPAGDAQTEHGIPESYEPFHRGHIALGSGIYVRKNEDLVVQGTPGLILRRTYISGYRVSKEFGVGTTHDGEIYLAGDGQRFQWASLILPGAIHIRFERTSPGSSVFNAMYEARGALGEWQGARLGWTGVKWALRRRDGSVMLFRGCTGSRLCSILESRDSDGHIIYYRRNRAGRLKRMEASADRWIDFEYGAGNRIIRAHASTGQHVRYEYDANARLSQAVSGDGSLYKYTYSENDEMATIEEPEADIENSYDVDGRCIKQINRVSDGSESYASLFTYRIENGAVVRTDTTQSDGSWTQYTWGTLGYPTSESWGRDGTELAAFTYQRDPSSNHVTSLTLTCPDRRGRPLRHSSFARPDGEEWIKWDLLRTHCSWSGRQGRRTESH